MCRNIKPLFNFDPPATDEEVRSAALQYVRKLSGFNSPSEVNEKAFDKAIKDISKITRTLINSLNTNAPSKDRMVEQEKARARTAKRFML